MLPYGTQGEVANARLPFREGSAWDWRVERGEEMIDSGISYPVPHF